MIIGIDPGFSGAIAFLYKQELDVVDLPIMRIKNRKQVDPVSFTAIINCAPRKIAFAAIEDVHSMPKQGVASTFKFGYNAGILLGVIQALGIKVFRIDPSIWKAALGISSDKKESLALAKKLFPAYKAYFTRVKDNGRAEAVLLAHFARKCYR